MTMTPNRLICSAGTWGVVLLTIPGPSRAATVSAVAEPAQVTSGETAVVTVRVSSSVAIYGYTLRMRLTPEEGATGAVTFNAAESTFGDPEALIGEALRAENFTEIKLADSDLVVSTNTEDQSAVKPASKRDVLVRAALTTSADATGTWTLEFVSPVSVLADGSFEAIETEWGTATVAVTSPSSGGCCCGSAAPVLGALLIGATALVCRRSPDCPQVACRPPR